MLGFVDHFVEGLNIQKEESHHDSKEDKENVLPGNLSGSGSPTPSLHGVCGWHGGEAIGWHLQLTVTNEDLLLVSF